MTKYLYKGILIMDYGKVKILNPDNKDNRICRTIKAQVGRNSLANFLRNDGAWGDRSYSL